MTKTVLAIATKACRTKKLYTWEQVTEYQNRGWQITMAR